MSHSMCYGEHEGQQQDDPDGPSLRCHSTTYEYKKLSGYVKHYFSINHHRLEECPARPGPVQIGTITIK